MPKVVMKDGIEDLRVIAPFIAPIQADNNIVTRKARKGLTPEFSSRAIVIADKANTELTDKSNSPEIIRKEMPTEIMPISEATVSIPAHVDAVRNSLESKVNKPITHNRLTTTPNSLILVNNRNFAIRSPQTCRFGLFACIVIYGL